MDFLSHATLGATTAILLTGQKTEAIALQGAILGVLPDLLGAPVIEGYHLLKNKLRVFTQKQLRDTFLIGTTHRWDRLPQWMINYYYLLHTVWFALVFTFVVYLIKPANVWWGPTFYFSHSFIDIFLHKDEPGRKFERAIRPFWPATFSIQVVQWSDIPLWGKIPVIPSIAQVAFWVWYIAG